jgi:phage terminase large subunit-like protein
MHAYKNPKQYNILKEATKAYTNKLVIGITTAGDDTTSFCYQRLQYCKKVLDGLVKDEAYFIFLCMADQDENGNVDYTNPIEHEKANPSYGVTIRPADIMNDAMQAQNDPQQRKDFLAKSLNIYTSAMKAYFNLAEFQVSNKKCEECLGFVGWSLEKKIEAAAKMVKAWFGGADLAKLYDLTAAALYGTLYNAYKDKDGKMHDVDIVITHAWFPIVAAAKKADEDGIPLFGWRDDGWLDMSNSPTTNHAEIVNWFVKMRKMGFKIKQVGHDRNFVESILLE